MYLTEDEVDVFDRDDDDQRPHDHRQHAIDGGFCHGEAVAALARVEGRLNRVEGTGADVAVDDAERRERQNREPAAGRVERGVLAVRNLDGMESRVPLGRPKGVTGPVRRPAGF
jgi:hypothetical protein